jgi:predicted membrane chloride channel (bestrophin family)
VEPPHVRCEGVENPFGHDANDLPLDQICRTMQVNIDDLIRVGSQD